ncbi:MAG: hypothetical protein H8D80_02050 [Proteobacteria bacterium]|nr:hypothetical protein [Pseudomonadota bacterium]
MPDPFDKLISDFGKSEFDSFTKLAIKWWRKTMRDLYGSEGAPTPPYKLAAKWIQAYKQRYGKTVDRTPIPGKMYIFRYSPTKPKNLDYWDNLPLIIALEKKRGGFLGLNLHYLSKKRRGFLLNQIASQLKNATDDDTEGNFMGEKISDIRTMYKSYKLLSAKQSVFKWAYPCIRRYKYNGIQTTMVEIPVTEWELATYLPSDYFFTTQSAGGNKLEYIHRESYYKKLKKFG